MKAVKEFVSEDAVYGVIAFALTFALLCIAR